LIRKFDIRGWRCKSVIEHLPSMLEALCSISQHHKGEKRKKEENGKKEGRKKEGRKEGKKEGRRKEGRKE
jgi:hypothetical protein